MIPPNLAPAAADPEPALRVENVRVLYGGNLALREVFLDIPKQQITQWAQHSGG